MNLQLTGTSLDPNGNARTYTVSRMQMSEWPRRVMFSPPFHLDLPGWRQIGDVGRRFLHPIFQMAGDDLPIIFLHPDHLTLVREPRASWEKIDSLVVMAAVRVFRRRPEVVEFKAF